MQQYTSINSVKYILQDLSTQLGFDSHRLILLIHIQTHHKASIFSIKLRRFSSQKFSVQDLAAAEQQRKQSARSNRQQPQSQCQRDVKEMSTRCQQPTSESPKLCKLLRTMQKLLDTVHNELKEESARLDIYIYTIIYRIVCRFVHGGFLTSTESCWFFMQDACFHSDPKPLAMKFAGHGAKPLCGPWIKTSHP